MVLGYTFDLGIVGSVVVFTDHTYTIIVHSAQFLDSDMVEINYCFHLLTSLIGITASKPY